MDNKIKCPYCDKEYNKHGLATHIKKAHPNKCYSKKSKLDSFEFNSETNKYKCPYCNKEFSKFGISSHIWRKHTEEGQSFSPTKNKTAWNKGASKETDERIKKSANTLHEGYQSGRLQGSMKGKHLTSEQRKKVSEKAKGNIKKIRFNKKNKTKQEQRIINILISHNIEFKHNYPNSIKHKDIYHHYIYDIAIIDLQIDIECDGWQHEMQIKIESDKLRDELSTRYGWIVLRFKNKEIDNKTDDELWNIILNVINNSKLDIIQRKKMSLENPYLSKLEEKKRSEEIKALKQELNRKHGTLQVLKMIKKVKECSIDFTKKEWSQQLSDLIGISANKTSEFLKNNFPELYKIAYKRNTSMVQCPYCKKECMSNGLNSHIRNKHPEQHNKYFENYNMKEKNRQYNYLINELKNILSIKEKIELIKQSNIDFSQKNWRSELRQLFNKKMSWDECYDFLKRYCPDIFKSCYKNFDDNVECPYCNKLFSKYGLQNHIRFAHK